MKVKDQMLKSGGTLDSCRGNGRSGGNGCGADHNSAPAPSSEHRWRSPSIKQHARRFFRGILKDRRAL